MDMMALGSRRLTCNILNDYAAFLLVQGIHNQTNESNYAVYTRRLLLSKS